MEKVKKYLIFHTDVVKLGMT